MKVVGICGSSGSGKSSLCEMLSYRGYPVLDCDKIYHSLVNKPSECLDEICRAFGQHLCVEGRLDRKELGKIVFASPEKLSYLNEISHRHVLNQIKKDLTRLEEQKKAFCFIDAPMLFESGLDKMCDFICAVISDPAVQISRVCERDHISKAEALKRLENQIPENILREKADFVVENNTDLNGIEAQCEILIDRIMNLKG